MKNKEIQEQRMRGYFIQAAKDMLRAEGLKSISVRAIADRAGYSYTTMYNYFKDVNDLIFVCVEDFFEECRVFVAQNAGMNLIGIEKLKATIISYANFFVEYPGIFDLFFIEKVGDFGQKQTTITLIASSFDKISEEDWNYCISQKLIDAGESERLKMQLKYSIFGLLLMYLNRRNPTSYSEFVRQLTDQVDFILQER
ncbi:MAG TPA: TetR/AcrR family transcriptional regulator [Williamwhitmania sp.]|nr:TetR/AcrR family transcriptional regulator [Williamwhitmania sp.]